MGHGSLCPFKMRHTHTHRENWLEAAKGEKKQAAPKSWHGEHRIETNVRFSVLPAGGCGPRANRKGPPKGLLCPSLPSFWIQISGHQTATFMISLCLICQPSSKAPQDSFSGCKLKFRIWSMKRLNGLRILRPIRNCPAIKIFSAELTPTSGSYQHPTIHNGILCGWPAFILHISPCLTFQVKTTELLHQTLSINSEHCRDLEDWIDLAWPYFLEASNHNCQAHLAE